MGYGETHRLDIAGQMPESVSVERDPLWPELFVIDAGGMETSVQIMLDATQLAALVEQGKELLS